MHKIQTALAVLLTVVVLFSGAYIPTLTACFIDGKTTGKGTLSPMTSVELRILQEISIAGKLAMMNRIDSLLPIRESKAGMTGEEVMNSVVENIKPYVDAQLSDFYVDDVEMKPYLVQVLDKPELQRVIWKITVSGDAADYSVYDLVIDDETGKILSINYTSENPQNPYGIDETLSLFADIFFSNLGIENHWDFIVEDLEYAYTGDHTIAVQFQLKDQRFGDIYIDMYVHDNGFYIEFPTIS